MTCKIIIGTFHTKKNDFIMDFSADTSKLSEGCDVIFKNTEFRKLSAMPGARWRGSGPDSRLIRRPEPPALKQSSEIVVNLHDSK
jgi:hypothetical protein